MFYPRSKGKQRGKFKCSYLILLDYVCKFLEVFKTALLYISQRGWNNQLCVFDFITMKWSIAETKVIVIIQTYYFFGWT